MQNITPIKLIKVRDFGEVFNASFEFIRQNLKPLFLSILYITGPLFLLNGIISTYQQATLTDIFGSGEYGAMTGSFFLSMVTVVLGVLASSFLTVTVYGYLILYERKNGEPISVGEVWEVVKENFLMVIVATIGYGLIAGVGFMFLVFPGIYLAVALSLIFMVQLRERIGFFKAISRCFFLIKENWWITFGLLFVTFIIRVVLVLVLALPVGLLVGIVGYTAIEDFSSFFEAGIGGVLVAILGGVITILEAFVAIIIFIPLGFQYYSLLEQKDAVGLVQEMESFGASDQSGASSDEAY